MNEKGLPRLLLDMNLSPLTLNELRELGWSAVRVSEVLPANTPDDGVLSYAREHGLIVVTHDVDFTTLLAIGHHAKPSVIHLRVENARPHFIAQRIDAAVREMSDALDRGVVVSVDETTLRYRSLPIS